MMVNRADLSPEIDVLYTLEDSPSGSALWDSPPDGLSDRFVWTVIETDRGDRVIPGLHYVNRIGYAVTGEPWASEDEEYAWGPVQ